jgi:hypothetical protein
VSVGRSISCYKYVTGHTDRASPASLVSAPPFVETGVQETTYCELPAIARGGARDSFAVLVSARAPGVTFAVRDAWIAATCAHPDVRVQADKSSGRQNNIVADGRAALVGLGDLRAGEEMRFLLSVNVPAASEDADVTRLLRVSCTYRDAATGKTRVVVGEDAVVRRPPDVTSQEDQKPSVEVQVERFRCQPTAGLGLLALILTMYLVLVFLHVV